MLSFDFSCPVYDVINLEINLRFPFKPFITKKSVQKCEDLKNGKSF